MQTPLNADIFAHADVEQHLKQYIKDYCSELKKNFDPMLPVETLIRAKSDFIDQILTLCWKKYLGYHSDKLALIAVGGYGRKELFPYSDIDILILLPDEEHSVYQEKLTDFSNLLWDIGLKPGQSVRTIEQCVQLAIDDQTIMTSLLEMHLIDGNNSLCSSLKKQITSDHIWPASAFFTAKMEEQSQRYAKFHDTAYNLEPNIKEGPGGLRDMQVIAWVFKRQYDSATLRELIKYDFLPEAEYKELKSALHILWRIRYALHVLSERCEDRLLFDCQRTLAAWFGFTESSNNQDIEMFMQFYFKTVVGLERLNEMLLQLFHERFVNDQKKPVNPEPINTKFHAIGEFIEINNDQVFINHPLALLEVFLLLQQIPTLKGIRATTIRQIRKHLHLINDDFRSNPTARRIFIEIFRQPHGLTHQLRRMNRYGVLSAYLPCFANIVARMQYDLFHIYTVDEHTLFVIRNLRRFSLDMHNDELPFCNSVYLLVHKPYLLYIAALFHDIAKGKGGDHSALGEEIAREFCIQHELNRHDTKLVAWLVKNHLILSMTAQRKDISDPAIIHEFAQRVGNTENLNYLYLLTVADIRATSPNLWNSWKDNLLKQLYTSTHIALRRGLKNPVVQNEIVALNKSEARKQLHKLGITGSTIETTWSHINNDDFFLRFYADEIAWHTLAIACCEKQDLPLVLLRPQNQRGSAEIFIYSTDDKSLFSLSTAIMDYMGLNILDARIISTDEGYVFNSFQVLEQTGSRITDLYREISICQTLRKHLLSGKIEGHQNLYRQSRQAKHFPIPTRIVFHNDHHHPQHTVMEIITTDRWGLLSKIGEVLTKQHILIINAKITTIGSRVEDMFYITDKHSEPITDEKKQTLIKTQLIELLG